MGFVLNLKRGETPFYRRLRSLARWVLACQAPVPGFLMPLCRAVYYLHLAAWRLARRLLSFLYIEPLFRARCASAGKRLSVFVLPHVDGHVKIHLGDDVNFFGKAGIISGRVFDDPILVIKDRVDIGHMVFISVNREVVIEEDVNIANYVFIADNDGHPRDPVLRARDEPPLPEEIRPVRICRNAWIGGGTYVHKGVTIGEGAIIGSNSVVVTDIPPFCVAMGNPARVVVKDTANRKTPG